MKVLTEERCSDESDPIYTKENKNGGEKVRPIDNRLQRTCGVPYERNKLGNYYSVHGFEGDQGHGLQSVRGGRVRNPVEQEQESTVSGKPTDSHDESTKPLTSVSSVTNKADLALTASTMLPDGKEHPLDHDVCARRKALSTPPKKKRRIDIIDKDKAIHVPSVENGEVEVDDAPDSLAADETDPKDERACDSDEEIWMSDDIVGMAEAEELAPIIATPEGVNLWHICGNPVPQASRLK